LDFITLKKVNLISVDSDILETLEKEGSIKRSRRKQLVQNNVLADEYFALKKYK